MCPEIRLLGQINLLESPFLDALERLIALDQEWDEPEAALEDARWLLLRDPLREDIHHQAMRLHPHQGEWAAFLHQYLHCQVAPRDRLGIQSAPETTAWCPSTRSTPSASWNTR